MARSRPGRRGFGAFSLSFLDCICCGFGAMLLLLVLSRVGAARVRVESRDDLAGSLARAQAELAQVREDAARLERELVARRRQLSDERLSIARLQGDFSRLDGQYAATRELSEVQDRLEGRMLAARQTLSEEMQRLLGAQHRRPPGDEAVGGIPVDSEYLVFVIDTSGSMHSFAWPLVVRKMRETLDAYPRVQGMQVMNDEGVYMFPEYAGRWIPDTPRRRQAVLQQLRTWAPFSNSSPVEGIEAAIAAFARPDRPMSIFVLGDEFTGDSIDGVIHAVRRMNRGGRAGGRKVRIHAIGFPTMFTAAGVSEQTGVRFAQLMRLLAEDNGGAFVGLNTTRP